MKLGVTPTLAICLTAGVAAGVALARPADQPAAGSPAPAPTTSVVATADPYVATQQEQAPVAAQVTIDAFAFSALPSVAAGSAIVVTNADSVAHTLTSTDGLFDTGIMQPGQSVTVFAPAAPGTYAFSCTLHPSMTGTFTVV